MTVLEEFSMRQQCLVLLLTTNCSGGTRLASHLHTSSSASMRYHYYITIMNIIIASSAKLVFMVWLSLCALTNCGCNVDFGMVSA